MGSKKRWIQQKWPTAYRHWMITTLFFNAAVFVFVVVDVAALVVGVALVVAAVLVLDVVDVAAAADLFVDVVIAAALVVDESFLKQKIIRYAVSLSFFATFSNPPANCSPPLPKYDLHIALLFSSSSPASPFFLRLKYRARAIIFSLSLLRRVP